MCFMKIQSALWTVTILSCFIGSSCTGIKTWETRTDSMNRKAAFVVSPNDAQGLEGARKRVAELRKAGEKGEIIVEFSEGVYRQTTQVAFTKADSGYADGKTIYRAAPGAKVVFTGAVPVTGFQKLTDAALLAQLPEEARGRVLVADLKAQGITNYGKLTKRGFGMGIPLAEAEVFYDNKPMRLVRWPKKGFFKALSKDETSTKIVLDVKGRAQRWKNEAEPWIFAYWHHDWAEIYEPIVAFGDKADEIVRDKTIKPRFGLTPARTRAYVLNVFSELSEPGEYYIDRKNGKLYFLSPYEGGSVSLSIAPGILKMYATSNVSFEGFTFEETRGTLVSFSNAENVSIIGCTLRNAGHSAVYGHGRNNKVYGCDVYDTGESGISLVGGNRKTLTNGNNIVENNHVHHFSRRARTYKTGVRVDGCGNVLRHNLIHHAPHMALAAGGNNHIIEYNEIHNAVYESGDAGAYYVGRDWTQRGNIIRHNYFHHIKGSSTYGGMTIYLDDQHCGYLIYGNLFERCNQSVFIGGGDDNKVINNVFVDCWKSAHLDNRGMGWQKKATDDPKGELRRYLANMPYKSPLWAKAYPELVNIENDDPGVPKRNVFRSNVSAGGQWDDINKTIRHLQMVEKNLVFDDDLSWITLKKDKNGKVLDIIYKDPKALEDIDFKPLQIQRFGVYRDPARASWPVEHPIEDVTLAQDDKAAASKRKFFATMPTASVPKSGDASKAVKIPLAYNYQGDDVKNPPAATVRHDGDCLIVTVTTPLAANRKLGAGWAGNEACEIALMNSDGANADIYIFRGFTNATFEGFKLVNSTKTTLPNAQSAKLTTQVTQNAWTCQWRIPLKLLDTNVGDRLRANITIRRTADNVFAMWRPTFGDSTNCHRVGFWELQK